MSIKNSKFMVDNRLTFVLQLAYKKFKLNLQKAQSEMKNTNFHSSLIEHMLNLFGKSFSKTPSGEDEAALYNDFARQLGEFLDEIPIGFFIYRADGDEKILYANKALIHIFGCIDYDDFLKHINSSFKKLVYHKDIEVAKASIAEQISDTQDAGNYVEYRIKRKDGELRYVEDYRHLIKNNLGDIYYVFVSDATEKIEKRISEKQALISEHEKQKNELQTLIEEYDKERNLIRREYLQRLEVIEGLSINYESILYADVNNNTVLPYRLSTRLNKQFDGKMQPKELKFVLEDYTKVWVHPDDKAHVAQQMTIEYISASLAASPTFYINYRCIENGEVLYIQLRAVNVSKNKDSLQVVLGYRRIDAEITAELKKKRLLQEALDTAKSADIAKNTFLSNMSHDMRTPVNALYGYTALLKKNASDPQAVLDYAEKIEYANAQMLNIVDKVLEISYIEAHDYTLKQKKCKIADIVNKACKPVCAEAERKNIEISYDLSDIQNERVYADSEKMVQMLEHIVHNAVNYTNDGGRVNITVHEQSSETHEFSVYEFVVTDNGIGISKEALERVFEPFEREYNTTHSGVFGAGLGLTIAKHIAEQAGGGIKVKSSPGKGSTFTVSVSLRICDDGDKTGAADEPFKLDPRLMTILLVEDNEINIEIETEILSDLGFTIDTAENGQIALDMLNRNPPDKYSFVLMDIQMPVMDGLTASAAIRNSNDPIISHIPIIALSANAFETDKRKSIEAGMDAHLTKPLDVEHLLKTATSILSARSKN